jgi:hypothetical protein
MNEEKDEKSAFENLNSIGGTAREQANNQSDSNMYETNYSKYLNHRALGQGEFD